MQQSVKGRGAVVVLSDVCGIIRRGWENPFNYHSVTNRERQCVSCQYRALKRQQGPKPGLR